MIIGELYLVKKFFWLLFPTKEVAVSGFYAASDRRRAYQNAKWFGKEYNCNIDVVEPNTCFVLLEQNNDYFKVLDSNGNLGWIRCDDFSKYFELVKAK